LVLLIFLSRSKIFSTPSRLNPFLRFWGVEARGTGDLLGTCGTCIVGHLENLEIMDFIDEESKPSMLKQCGEWIVRWSKTVICREVIAYLGGNFQNYAEGASIV
jgi:hypothetical protein